MIKHNNKILSIIIPYKNIANYLVKLLESIFNEANVFDVQVIVVNDNSTEQIDTFEKIKAKYCNMVLFLENVSVNAGAGAARNVGLQMASGKWLLFADADDYFVDGWFTIVKKFFSVDADIVFFEPVAIMDNGVEKSLRTRRYKSHIDNYIQNPNQHNEDVLRYDFVVPWSKLIKRDLIVDYNIKFDEVIYGNDNMFSAKIGRFADKIIATHNIIYCAIERQESLIKEKSIEAFYSRVNVRCNRYNYVKKNIGLKRLQKIPIGSLWIQTIRKILIMYHNKECDFNAITQTLQLLHKNNVKIYITYRQPIYLIKKLLKIKNNAQNMED